MPKPVMKDIATFRAHVGASLFRGWMTPRESDGIDFKLAAFSAAEWNVSWCAYALATCYHETGRTMVPVHELGSAAYFAKYDTGPLAKALGNTPARDGDGMLYMGRGDVQITGHANYAKFGQLLGIDLVDHPDMALEPAVSAQIMVRGMGAGLFTGKGLSAYLPFTTLVADVYRNLATDAQFVQARRVINGLDHAQDIAAYADEFQSAMVAGGWG